VTHNGLFKDGVHMLHCDHPLLSSAGFILICCMFAQVLAAAENS
jgi:hypothetical protein